MCESKLIEYLNDIADVVFEDVDTQDKSSVDFLNLEKELYQFNKKIILQILPSLLNSFIFSNYLILILKILKIRHF